MYSRVFQLNDEHCTMIAAGLSQPKEESFREPTKPPGVLGVLRVPLCLVFFRHRRRTVHCIWHPSRFEDDHAVLLSWLCVHK